MKKKHHSRSGFFNTRIVLSFVLCSVGVFLSLLGYGAFSNTFAQATTSVPAPVAPLTEETEEMSPADANGRFVQLIEFAEPGVLQRAGHNSGEHFKADTPQARAALEQIKAEQAVHVQAIANAIGRQPDVTHHFLMTHSGIATRLTPEEAQIVRMIPGVKSVERERVYHVDTFRSPFFIGADKIWDGTAVPGGVGTRGQGIVIADLDTGNIPTHPSFVNDASCGHGVGGAPNKLISQLDCATATGPGGLCNGPNPNDANGHGSHTSSTAGGNVVPTSAVPPPSAQIQGVAPCANIRMYKVCPTSSCPSADITAGINSVLLHSDVDVLNFSISGGTSPWADNDRRFLDLVAAGIVVSASAGNTSATIPNPVGQVNHRGPWVTTVAASTKDAAGPGTGDILANFSLRGPIAGTLQNLTKPDVTGPGVSIYAAVISNYGNMSGTSMSCPHLTGSSALLRAIHPTWLPEEVKSALMMVSFADGHKEDGSTPWDADDVGTGRVDLLNVAKAGLVMNETFANFLAADPATGGDPKTLNIPSARNMNCVPSCVFTRTVRNTKTVPTSWTAHGATITPGLGFIVNVLPTSFNFTGNLTETQVLTITAFPSTTVPQPVLFGEVRLTETGGLSPQERISVAIKGPPQGATPSPTGTPTAAPSPTSDPFPTTPTPTATTTIPPSPTPCAPGWSAGPTVPPVALVRAPGNFFPANGKFYSIGGRSADVAGADFVNPFEYDPVANTWATKPSTLPDGLVNNMACGVLTVGGTPQIYCVGGSQSQVVGTTGRVFSYNPATDTFTTLAAGDNWPGSQTNTFLPGGFAVNGNKLYIIGSFNANATPPVMTAQVWQFDPTAAVGSKWLARADYPLMRGYVPAASIGGFIYTGGGSALDATGALIDSAESFKYDVAGNAWTPITNIPRATGETRAVVMNGKMWVLGGGRTAPNPSSQVNIYDPVANSWSLGAPFNTARRNFPADSNGTDRIFLAGGYNTALLNTTEIFGANVCPSPTPPGGTPTPSPSATPTATATATATIPPAPTPTPTPITTPTPTPSVPPAAQAINLSTRMNVQLASDVGIGGFIITAGAPKYVLLRGIGPSLTQVGVPNALVDPVIELHGPSGFTTIINDNWRDTQELDIQATGIPPTNNFEAAIVTTLNPGAYTAIIKGNNDGTGVGLIEVFDLSQTVPSKLGNISTRALVGTGADVVIAGFILGNNSGEDHVIIRGIGPSLSFVGLGVPDALSNPALELRDGNAALLNSNNDWLDNQAQAAEIIAAGLALGHPAESGISVRLGPGLYTAILSGEAGTTGVGLVEVYDLGNDGGVPAPSPTPPGTPAPTVTPPPGTPSPSPSSPPVSPTPSPQQCLQPFDSVTPPALPAGWTATLVTGDPPTWVTTNIGSDSPPNNLFVPDQDGISDKTIDSCNISIFSPTAQIKFRNSFNTEHDPPPAEVFWDGFVIEVSVGGGAFQDLIDAGGSFVSGGYTGEIDGTANNPLAGRQAWSGDSGGYINSTINLPASFNGQTIKIRFRIGTDEAVAAPGVHIDGFQVIGGSCACSP